MTRIALLSFLASLLMTSPILAQSTKLNPQRLITLAGVIDETTLGKANDLLSLAETSKEPVDILIASPGGTISYGLFFIQAMKSAQAEGVKIRCFVPELAASMAYTIFTQCSERYALPYAQLLFHSPRISGSFTITPQSAVQLAQGLMQIEKVLLDLIAPIMGVTKENGGVWFVQNYLDETLFLASDLLEESPTKWFTVVHKIGGVSHMNLYPNVWARAEALGEKSETKPNYDYTYTQPK